MKTLETLNLEVLKWITHSNLGTEPTINASRIKTAHEILFHKDKRDKISIEDEF